mgnify:CR=1 FL=1
MGNSNTSHKILSIAQDILASEGLGAISFDAIARQLGRTKQAVLYWYPTKQDLLSAMFLPWLEAETDTAEKATANVTNRTEAIHAFVSAVAHFHLRYLDRFRMMYLLPQTMGSKSINPEQLIVDDELYAITDRLYLTLAVHLGADENSARKEAVAIHSSVLGLVMMFALADALGDPLKHSETELIEALITSFTSSSGTRE